ncbi:MAG: acetylserotonin O-methyltransferase [Deltaproteobacteria bacterium]|nr:acetylserotonin O-methyltransferase [Deltaproteobacteria bacterium]
MNFSQLMGMASGHVDARIVQTGVELGVFEAMEFSPLNAETIATSLKLNQRGAELLLNALAGLQLLRKESDTFSLTEIARHHLIRSSPRYVGGMIRFDAALWPCWERLPEAIRTGAPTRRPDMYQDDLQETEVFIEAMDSLVKARGDAGVVASALNWDEVSSLLDLGSGPGTYPIWLCRGFPNLRAAIFDLRGTLNVTKRYVREAGLTDRIELIAGDYRTDPIPGNYDVIFLSNIIHGEGIKENQALIVKLAANLQPKGRIVIKDHILDENRANPTVGAVFSLLMLLTTGSGRCYSFGEVNSWLENAGFRKAERIDLPPPLTSSLIVARK